MEAARPVGCRLTPEAAEFVRFCYGRRRLGWPELYDEMCAVASRGMFRGWGPDELAQNGIGFGLFELPALAGLVAQVVAEEQAVERERRRRPSEPVVRAPDEARPAERPAERPSELVPTSLADERRARDVGVEDAPTGPMLRPALVPIAS